MKMLIFISLLVLCSIHPSCALKDILKKGPRLYKIVNKLINTETNAITPESIVAQMRNRYSKIGKLLADMKDEVRSMKNTTPISEVFAFIRRFVNVVSPVAQLYQWSLKVQDAITNIDFDFIEFWSVSVESSDPTSWKTFASMNHDLNSRMQQQKIMLIASPHLRNLHPGLLFLIVKETSMKHSTYCSETMYIQYFLAHFLQALITTEIKALTMITYTTMVQHADDWKPLLRLRLNNFRDRYMIYVKEFLHFMDIAPKDLTACDPANGTWIRNDTYLEMEHIEQVVIRHYRSLFRDKNCDNALEKKLLTFDFEQDTCNGTLSDCQYSGWLEVCRLKQNAKRYEWIKARDGNYGMNFDKCTNGSIRKYIGITNWFESHCICKCHEHNHAWISLDQVITDIHRNMVITGFKFVHKEGVLYIQGQQGRLLPDGYIDYDSEEWIPLPKNPKLAAITPNNNKFYLDDVILPEDYLAVGLEFHDDNGFSIGVTGKQFNFSTAELLQQTYHNVAEHTDYEQLLLSSQNSIYTNITHTPDSNKKWVELHISHLQHDAGQSMLPFFYGGAVEANSPVGGVGMVHKGADNYAGFISPRLFPLQYRKYLSKFIEDNANGKGFYEK